MFHLRKIVAVGLFLLLPLAVIAERHDHKKECFRKDRFKIEDLEGSYIVQGVTAGGPQLESFAEIFLITFRRDGTGVVRSLTSRTFTGTPPATLFQETTPLKARPPATGTVQATLNSDGTAQIIFFGVPTAADQTLDNAVFKKSNGSKKITGGFAVRVGVNGPSADSPFANQTLTTTYERQLD